MPKKRKIVKIDSRTGRTLCVYKSLSEAAVCTGQTQGLHSRLVLLEMAGRRWVRPEQPPQKKDHRLS